MGSVSALPYMAWVVFPAGFSFWLRQEGPPCGEGGAAARVLYCVSNVRAAKELVGGLPGRAVCRRRCPCVRQVCVRWPPGPSCGQASPGPAWGLLAPTPALAISGTGCVSAWGAMGNPAQARDAGASGEALWTAFQPPGIGSSFTAAVSAPGLSLTSKAEEGQTNPVPSGDMPCFPIRSIVLLLSKGTWHPRTG